MAVLKRKVAAYITWDDRVLVFRQPHAPEAGVQVPAGTLEDGEEPGEAVLREAWEETGLEGLERVAYLGRQVERFVTKGGDEMAVERHFFHLRFEGEAPERWRHWEMTPSGGVEGPILFELWWAPVGEVRGMLNGWFAAMLEKVVCDSRGSRR